MRYATNHFPAIVALAYLIRPIVALPAVYYMDDGSVDCVDDQDYGDEVDLVKRDAGPLLNISRVIASFGDTQDSSIVASGANVIRKRSLEKRMRTGESPSGQPDDNSRTGQKKTGRIRGLLSKLGICSAEQRPLNLSSNPVRTSAQRTRIAEEDIGQIPALQPNPEVQVIQPNVGTQGVQQVQNNPGLQVIQPNVGNQGAQVANEIIQPAVNQDAGQQVSDSDEPVVTILDANAINLSNMIAPNANEQARPQQVERQPQTGVQQEGDEIINNRNLKAEYGGESDFIPQNSQLWNAQRPTLDYSQISGSLGASQSSNSNEEDQNVGRLVKIPGIYEIPRVRVFSDKDELQFTVPEANTNPNRSNLRRNPKFENTQPPYPPDLYRTLRLDERNGRLTYLHPVTGSNVINPLQRYPPFSPTDVSQRLNAAYASGDVQLDRKKQPLADYYRNQRRLDPAYEEYAAALYEELNGENSSYNGNQQGTGTSVQQIEAAPEQLEQKDESSGSFQLGGMENALSNPNSASLVGNQGGGDEGLRIVENPMLQSQILKRPANQQDSVIQGTGAENTIAENAGNQNSDEEIIYEGGLAPLQPDVRSD